MTEIIKKTKKIFMGEYFSPFDDKDIYLLIKVDEHDNPISRWDINDSAYDDKYADLEEIPYSSKLKDLPIEDLTLSLEDRVKRDEEHKKKVAVREELLSILFSIDSNITEDIIDEPPLVEVHYKKDSFVVHPKFYQSLVENKEKFDEIKYIDD